MWVESIVCNISVVFSVVFLRHSVVLHCHCSNMRLDSTCMWSHISFPSITVIGKENKFGHFVVQVVAFS